MSSTVLITNLMYNNIVQYIIFILLAIDSIARHCS